MRISILLILALYAKIGYSQSNFGLEIYGGVVAESRTLDEIQSYRTALAKRSLRFAPSDDEPLSPIHFTSFYQIELRANPFSNRRIWLNFGYLSGSTPINETVITQNETKNAGTFEVQHHFNEKLYWSCIRIGGAWQWSSNVKRISFYSGVQFEVNIQARYEYLHHSYIRPAGSNEDFFYRPPNSSNGDISNRVADLGMASPILLFHQRVSYSITKHLSFDGSLYYRWGIIRYFSDISGPGASLGLAWRIN